MGSAELTYLLRNGKNSEKIHGGTEMKHFNAVGWSDFVDHVADGGGQMVMQKHRGARRKHYLRTAALCQKVADAAVVEAGYQPALERVRFVEAAFAQAGLAAQRQEIGSSIQVLYDSVK